MTKTIPEIDDAMIQRFERAALVMDATGAWVCKDTRAGLTAALTPEPEIEVTEAMINEGRRVINTRSITTPNHKGYEADRFLDNIVTSIYRAMVKAAPKGAKSAPQGVNTATPFYKGLPYCRVTPDFKADDETEKTFDARMKAAYAAKDAAQGVNAGAPEKATGGGVERKEWKFHDREGDSFMTRHRRSTDPK